jgi:hypothetical protein
MDWWYQQGSLHSEWLENFMSNDDFSMTKPIMEMEMILDACQDATTAQNPLYDWHHHTIQDVSCDVNGDEIAVLLPIWFGDHATPTLLEVPVSRGMRSKRRAKSY